MTINAAMPALTPNTSYTGTAAANDIANGTASDFSGTLGNMVNARETATVDTATTQSEVDTQMTMVENSQQTAVLTEQMDLLHKELMMKNAGYAQSELIAMLLSGSNAELSELMSFGGESMQNLGNIEGVEAMAVDAQLSGENELITVLDGMTDETEIPAEETEGFEMTVKMAPEADISGKEQTSEMTKQMSETTEQMPEMAQQMPETAQQMPEMAQQKPETAQQKPEVAEQIPEAKEQKPETAQQISEASEQMDVTVMTTGTATENTVAMQETANTSDVKMTTGISETDVETVGKADMVMSEEVATEKLPATQTVENTVTAEESEHTTFRLQPDEKLTVVEENSADNSENAEDMVEFERPFAQAGKKISEKSEEALQLAKSISKTKSDSDLETEQKVTVKQELTDGGIMKNDVRFEKTEMAEPRSEAPVRLTVNETYQLISERASSATGKQTFTVVLNPESLGKITVKMVSEGGKLSVEILTETDAAKQLFESRANELANNLRQSNVEIESYRVETDNDQLFNESFDGSSKNPYANQQQNEKSDDEDEFERLISEMMGM